MALLQMLSAASCGRSQRMVIAGMASGDLVERIIEQVRPRSIQSLYFPPTWADMRPPTATEEEDLGLARKKPSTASWLPALGFSAAWYSSESLLDIDTLKVIRRCHY